MIISDDSYYIIHGWMINRLGLRGTALNAYAAIHSFSCANEHGFTGSLTYLAELCGVTRRTMITTMQELTESDYVIRCKIRDSDGRSKTSYIINTNTLKADINGNGDNDNGDKNGEKISPRSDSESFPQENFSQDFLQESVKIFHRESEKNCRAKGENFSPNNKDINTTTTTNNYLFLARTRTCAREEKPEPPEWHEVYEYFRTVLCMDNSVRESSAFFAYNAKRGWDCLPRWKESADLWEARKYQKEGYT